MSDGVAQLLQAAQYLEQQEKLKLSPIASSEHQHQQITHRLIFDGTTNVLTTSTNNNNNNNICSKINATTVNNNNNNNHNNNNNNININIRTLNGRNSQYHASLSAPAAGATFQHTNGLTITATSAPSATLSTSSTSSTSNGSQLNSAVIINHRRSGIDYEFSGNNSNFTGNLGSGVTIIATAAGALATNSSPSPSSSSSSSSPIAATVTSSNGRSSDAGRMSEDEISSFSTPNSQNKLSPTASASNSFANEQQQKKQKQKHEHEHDYEQQQQEHQQNLQHNENNSKLKSFSLVDGNNRSVAGVVACKQMLLNSGVRIASPATVDVSTIATTTTTMPTTTTMTATTTTTTSKAINIQTQQQQTLFANKFLATSSPSTFSLHAAAMPRYKSLHNGGNSNSNGNGSGSVVGNPLTLTPPSNSSRKLSEPYPRIRSFSMSSHKISALHHNGGGGSHGHIHINGSSQMIVDDAPNTIGAGGNHSPPRSGNHYLQMMSSGSQGSSHHHLASLSGGRRRTISSNSNGACNREVHNILEKNRRAHLKGCYDELKGELQLNDEERSKKTSNLAVLNAAIETVKSLQIQEKDDETEMEQLAKEKINLQKRIVNLKRELGPKCEQFFPDTELGNIQTERDIVHDSVSLSSGRGSTLYSSSSSLSSGGSSSLMFSPVGAGLQTTTPTAISPVIAKINNGNNNSNTTAGISSISNITNITNLHNHNNSIGAVHPTAITLTDSAKGVPLIMRGSPTPSTPSPSPSPSSSSGVSSSCSLISSSPPMGGVISNGRSVTVNIPFHQTNSGGATIGTIGNGTASAAATIIATSPPNANSAVRNNAHVQVAAASPIATLATTITTPQSINNMNNFNNINGYRRKTSLSISEDGKTNLKTATIGTTTSITATAIATVKATATTITTKAKTKTTTIKDYEDNVQQPAAKCIKVFNGVLTKDANHKQSVVLAKQQQQQIGSSNANGNVAGSLHLSQVVGGGSLVVSPSFFNAGALRTHKSILNGQQQNQNGVKNIILNGTTTAKELGGRLPGGAELNILPSNVTIYSNGNINGNVNVNASNNSCTKSATTTTAFYHANGKLTLVNSGGATAGSGGILLKDHLSGTPSGAALTPIIVSTTSNANSGLSGINASTNFAQLLAASTIAPNQTKTLATIKAANSVEHLNGKFRLSVGDQAPQQINTRPHMPMRHIKGDVMPTTATAIVSRSKTTKESTTITTNAIYNTCASKNEKLQLRRRRRNHSFC